MTKNAHANCGMWAIAGINRYVARKGSEREYLLAGNMAAGASEHILGDHP
jgi:hypothetical protein